MEAPFRVVKGMIDTSSVTLTACHLLPQEKAFLFVRLCNQVADLVKVVMNLQTFVVPSEKGFQDGRVLTGVVSIKLIAKGDCFYDITKIKDITNSSAGQAYLKAAGSAYGI